MDLSNLSNEELLLELRSLKGSETRTTLSILYYLIEVEDRAIYRDAGYSSLFDFAVRGLGYSDASAGRRVSGARCLREHPELAQLFLEGKVNLCTISTAARSIKAELCKLEDIAGKTKKEVELLIAPLVEQRPRERIKPVVVKGTSTTSLLPKELREERYEIKFSLSKEDFEKLACVKAKLSNTLRKDLSMEALMNWFVSDYDKRQSTKRKLSKKPPRTDTRRIPVSIKKEVLERDQRQCTYVAPDGTRCTERHYLNFDHIVPFAKGGSSESLNLRLLCSRHNKLLAEQVFGKDQVDYYVLQRKFCSKRQIN